jgi:hypothetical protein
VTQPVRTERHERVEQEANAAATAPGISAERTEGGPIVLVPTGELEPQPELPTSSQMTAATTTASAPAITPPPPPADLASERETAARQALPPETASALTTPTASSQAPASSSAEAGAAEVAEAATPEASAAEQSAATTALTPESVEAAAQGAGGGSGAAADSGGAVVGAGAGAAQVPPPQPERLRAVVPARALTPEERERERATARTPEQTRAEVMAMLDSLRADAEREKASILEEAEAQKAEVAALAEAQVANVQGSIETEVASIQALFAAARSNLTAYVEQQKAALQAQVAQNLEQVNAETTARIAEMDAQLTERQTSLTAYTEEQSRQPTLIADQEAGRARSELEAAANESVRAGESVASRYPGDEDPMPKRRAAAHKVGTESANDIREKIPAIDEELHNRAAEFSGRYTQYATGVNTQIDQAKPDLTAALKDAATSVVATLQQGGDAAMQAMDDRLQVDLQALAAGEAQAIDQVRASGEEAIAQIRSNSEQTAGEIDAGAAALVTEIDNTVAEAVAVVSAEQNPYLPGISDVIEAARSALMQTSATGRAQVSASASNIEGSLEEIATSFASQASELTATAQESANSIEAANHAAISQTIESNNTQAQSSIAEMTSQQQEVITQALTQIDQGVENAHNEMNSVTEQFRTEAREKTDESITEAKKPLTDSVWTRAVEAAETVGEILLGLLSAIGELVVGFLIMVAIAVVVAAIFGLTLGAALLIVGAIFLIAGVIAACYNRSRQLEAMGRHESGAYIFGLALMDATGITGIREAITGEEAVTGRHLGARERTRRGTVGLVTLVGIVLGARSAVKGPPGGWTRPTGLFGEGPFDIDANFRGTWGELTKTGSAIAGAVKRGYEAIRQRVSGETVPPEGSEVVAPGVTEVLVDSPARIQSTEPVFVPNEPDYGPHWYWDLYDGPSGAKFCKVRVRVPDATTEPTRGPELELTPKTATLPDGRQVTLKSNFSWTPEAIRVAMERFQTRFGYRPPSMPGELDWANLANFQKEFARIRAANLGMSNEAIANQAIQQMSFGKHRVPFGYADFHVTVSDFGDVTFKDGTLLQNVPRSVVIDARPNVPTVPAPPTRTRRDEE